MIATGRNFKSAMEELKDLDLTCDYLVGSGAEVRTPDQKIIKSCPISAKLCREAYEVMKEYPISILFSGAEYDYRIGTCLLYTSQVHGDQYVTIQIQVPRYLNSEARKKLKEYEQAGAA